MLYFVMCELFLNKMLLNF